MEELEDYIRNNNIDIAALTIPAKEAKEISILLYDLGIRYFWNFTNEELDLPKDAIIQNVHLLDSLLELSYTISNVKTP